MTNFMPHFYMFVQTNANVKLSNGNTGHAQGIGIILCNFTNCTVIDTTASVYYFPGHPSNTISSSALTYYVSFKKVMFEPLKHGDFVEPQVHYWRSPYQNQNNLDYIQI